MSIIYLLFVHLAQGLLSLANGFLKAGKLKSFIEGRKQQDLSKPLPKTGKRYWFHCASLGEFEQARPVIEALKEHKPETSIVITFFSPSGYEQRKDYALADAVLYLPLDTPANARALIQYLQPDEAVFVKYEIWYFYLKQLQKAQIPVYLISAVFRPGQFIFSFTGSWLFNLLPGFATIFLQDENSYQLLKQKGLNNIQLSGDTRYDRVKQNALKVKLNQRIETFKGSSPLLILGSSWQAEEQLALTFLDDPEYTAYKVLIVPHDISPSHIDEIYSSVKKHGASLYTESSPASEGRVLVMNTIGHLASAYYYGDMAVIGGAFGKGLHNILEALSFGVPVVFGPNTSKYPEAALAMHSEVALSISDYKGLSAAIQYFLPEGHLQLDTRAKCIDFINWHSGATDKVLKMFH